MIYTLRPSSNTFKKTLLARIHVDYKKKKKNPSQGFDLSLTAHHWQQ